MMLRHIQSIVARVLLSGALLGIFSSPLHAQQQQNHSSGNALIAEYFERRTAEIEQASLADITSQQDWQTHRQEYRDQLQEMLGLTPWPERGPLNDVVTSRIEHDDIVVECLHFQSLPGLYVTANFYRPKVVTQPLPAILYVCGHATMRDGTRSLGNKTGYQRHGAWYARNGYTCLTIDTIQLGEIPGDHHGTHAKGEWWWHGRGYTPLGVETWNGIRALDYLQSRPEVDAERIGLTGRSGGGAYTWFLAAMDDRVKAAVPVAGITSLRNHIVDGVIAGHCDCMFQTNLYGWDYPQLAALISPRPLLIANQDKDPIFPVDGVFDVFQKTRRIYDLEQASDKLGIFLCEGGHNDVQELQLASFRWFNRFLKNDTEQVTQTAEPLFEPKQLAVFTTLPEDERVTTAQKWFIPAASIAENANTRDDFLKQTSDARRWLTTPRGPASSLRSQELNVTLVNTWTRPLSQLRLREYHFNSGVPYQLSLYVLDHSEEHHELRVTLKILDEAQWQKTMSKLRNTFPDFPVTIATSDERLAAKFSGRLAFFAPRGVGPTAWAGDKSQLTHIRRRFALLGTTLEQEQLTDVLTAIKALNEISDNHLEDLRLSGSGTSAGLALYAAFVSGSDASPKISSLILEQLPTTPEARPQFLALDQHVSLQDVFLDVASRTKLNFFGDPSASAEFFKNAEQQATRLEIPMSITRLH